MADGKGVMDGPQPAMRGASTIRIVGLTGLPVVTASTDLGAEIALALARQDLVLERGDIIVVAQKIVSKAEGRLVRLADLCPTNEAVGIATKVRKDPRYVQAVLSESASVVRAVPDILITEHRLGHIMANAGIDQSNVQEGDGSVLLLPIDPDGSARKIRDSLCPDGEPLIGVVISDSFGRPWRIGTTGTAIGVCGVPAVIDMRGGKDMFGRALQVTEVAFADAVAAAGVLIMGEAAEGIPAALVRGLSWAQSNQGAASVLRNAKGDLFR